MSPINKFIISSFSLLVALSLSACGGGGKNNSIPAVPTVPSDPSKNELGLFLEQSAPKKSVDWNFSCPEDKNLEDTDAGNALKCQYRFDVQKIDEANADYVVTGSYADAAQATQATGDGKHFLYVQYRVIKKTSTSSALACGGGLPSGYECSQAESKVFAVSAVLDNTAPMVTLVTVPADRTGPAQSMTWSWACSDIPACTFRATVTTTAIHTFDDNDTYSSDTSIIKPDGDGIYYAHVQAIDAAGNESDVLSSAAVEIDNTAPAIAGVVDDLAPAPSKTWNWSCVDASDNCTFRSAVNTVPRDHDFGSAAYSSADTATQPNGDGTYYVHIQAEDAAGNRSAQVTVSAVLDNTPPAVTINDPGFVNAATQRSFAASGTCTAGDGDVSYNIGGQGFETVTALCNGTNWSSARFTLSAFADGPIVITASQTDVAGNKGAATTSVMKDTVAPAVTISNNLNTGFINAANQGSYRVHGSCAAGDEDVNYSVGNVDGTTSCDSNGAWSDTVDVMSLEDGFVDITAAQSDAAGNSGAAEELVTKDIVAPVFSITEDGTAWTWTCEHQCRFAIITTNSPAGDSDYGSWEAVATAEIPTDAGTHYIHVQSRDEAGNLATQISEGVLVP